jgi:hypothetical protein
VAVGAEVGDDEGTAVGVIGLSVGVTATVPAGDVSLGDRVTVEVIGNPATVPVTVPSGVG